jgi:hypothetical protein
MDDEADVADLKVVYILMLWQHRRNDLVPQRAAPCSTRTYTVNDDDLQICDPAEFAEVDRFRSDPEFPQYDSVQRWSWLLILCTPLGSHTGGRVGERGGGA